MMHTANHANPEAKPAAPQRPPACESRGLQQGKHEEKEWQRRRGCSLRRPGGDELQAGTETDVTPFWTWGTVRRTVARDLARSNNAPTIRRTHGHATRVRSGDSDSSRQPQSLSVVASRYLVLMRCEGGEDFSLLTRRHFGEVKAAPQLGRHLVEFFWRDLEGTMRLHKAGCNSFGP